jgi:hypothetical protein
MPFMKNLLSVLFSFIFFSSIAQVNTVMPQEANTFYSKAMPSIKPQIKSFIEKNAAALKEKTINIDSLCKALSKDQLLKNASVQDIEAIGVLIMVQATKNADDDLKSLVINKHKNGSELNTDSKVETILENKSRMAESASELMKRISGAQDLVINNLR